MSLIIKTLDSITTFQISDYVQFHKNKVGCITQILNTDTVKILEAGEDAINRLFRVKNNDCKVEPKCLLFLWTKSVLY